ncbi:thrombospondin type 3 repeat-containing protein [Candidatus Gracilibacteria bacterium]|nr:thrombospondin type 3 repeat-containing protein [Candidatus Gracilibacteria bacterium]
MKKLFLLSFLSIFYLPVSFSAAPDVSEYPLSKKIRIPSLSKSTSIGIDFDQELLSKIGSEFEDIQIINSKKEEVPFLLLDKKRGKIKEFAKITTSSSKNSDDEFLIDNDSFTTFNFDEKIDAQNDSWALIELTSPQNIYRIQIIPKSTAVIRSIEVKGGNNEKDLKTIIAKRTFDRNININSEIYKFIKISFWGTSIKIDDICLFAKKSASVYFDAKPGQSYRILYGNPILDSKRYSKRIDTIPENIALIGKLETQRENPSFPDDYDKDGIMNHLDNCVFKKNKKQEDIDKDQVGDLCDNAFNVKNYDQADLDDDGIGDIIDNCKDQSNLDQKDSDQDGIGDACDTINNRNTTTTTEKQTSFPFLTVFIVISLTLLSLGGLTLYVRYKH